MYCYWYILYFRSLDLRPHYPLYILEPLQPKKVNCGRLCIQYSDCKIDYYQSENYASKRFPYFLNIYLCWARYLDSSKFTASSIHHALPSSCFTGSVGWHRTNLIEGGLRTCRLTVSCSRLHHIKVNQWRSWMKKKTKKVIYEVLKGALYHRIHNENKIYVMFFHKKSSK